jgi:hypothetical protein
MTDVKLCRAGGLIRGKEIEGERKLGRRRVEVRRFRKVRGGRR